MVLQMWDLFKQELIASEDLTTYLWREELSLTNLMS